jgi:DNA-nicking Smr family endonuclease
VSPTPQAKRPPAKTPPSPVFRPGGPPSRAELGKDGLDSSWERKLARAAIAPDFTLDLHGHTLDQAHRRLDAGLAQAKAMGARLVLLITGKARPVDAADRGHRRGAIRAKVLDWLAAGPHAADIAAIRGAHRRHGGDGALYVVLRRTR